MHACVIVRLSTRLLARVTQDAHLEHTGRGIGFLVRQVFSSSKAGFKRGARQRNGLSLLAQYVMQEHCP